MPRIETRVTSVQVVPGFPACFAIPNPPGWDPLPLGYGPSDASAHIPGCQSRPRDVGEDIDDLWFSSTPDISWPPDLSLPRRDATNVETLPASGTGDMETPIDSISIETTSDQQLAVQFSLHSLPSNPADVIRFTQQKILKERTFLNYAMSRGDWMEEPPTSLDFGSCKDGPIVFVNKVVQKKVVQIWKWDVVERQWSSIREGEMFYTSRERLLEIDKNQIPRLRAVRNRKAKSQCA